jgi:hypothetical protein
MSDQITMFIPEEPNFVPTRKAQQVIRNRLTSGSLRSKVPPMSATGARIGHRPLVLLALVLMVGCGGRTTLNPLAVPGTGGAYAGSGGAMSPADARPATSPDLREADAVPSDPRAADAAPDLMVPDAPTSDAPEASHREDVAAEAGRTDLRPPDLALPDLRLADVAPPDAQAPDGRTPDLRPDLAPDLLSPPDTPIRIDAADGPAAVGGVAIPAGQPFALAIQDNLLYVGDWGNNAGILSIVDVSTPTQPRIVGTYSSPDAEIQAVSVRQGRAYLANDSLGITVVDVSDPSSPGFVRSRAEPTGPLYAHAVATGNFGTKRTAYAMLGGFYGSSLEIYDITTSDVPNDPVVYSSWNQLTRDIIDVAAANDVGCLLISDGESWMGLETIDLGRLPSPPALLGSLSLPIATYGGWGRIRLSGNNLYLATSAHTTHVGGLRVIDVSDVKAPKVIGSLDLADIGNVAWEGVGLDVVGSRAYILGTTALHVLDVSNPRKPVEAMALPIPAPFGSSISDGGNVVVAGDYAYAAVSVMVGGGGGVVIFKVTGP